MSTRDRAGQVVMIGTGADHPEAFASTARRLHLGGAFLVRPASVDPATLRRRIRLLQAAVGGRSGVRLQIAVDQEGGAVQTLKGFGFERIPSATRQGRWVAGTLRKRAASWARQLAGSGITMDLAPVADTVPAGTASRNPPIGASDRQYGATPAAVAADVTIVIRALQQNGVTATAKHFPGLGRVRQNTDRSAAAVDGVTTVDDPALTPFAAAIDSGVAAVMISSARYPRLDRRSEATFSRPIITGLLRGRMQFDGVIISDDLGAAVAVRSVAVGQRAVRFVAAGGDLVLSVRTGDAGPMTAALADRARRSAAFAARLKDAARHVLEAKERTGLLGCNHFATSPGTRRYTGN